jgi:hypothetical protein
LVDIVLKLIVVALLLDNNARRMVYSARRLIEYKGNKKALRFSTQGLKENLFQLI